MGCQLLTDVLVHLHMFVQGMSCTCLAAIKLILQDMACPSDSPVAIALQRVRWRYGVALGCERHAPVHEEPHHCLTRRTPDAGTE